jgi:hypothetical protein
MIMSNKHWKAYEQAKPEWHTSPAWRKAIEFQLQDTRYMSIHHLSRLGMLDLYGKGWPDVMVAGQVPDGEKIETLRKYKYSLAIENISMPGYVTEKIIDCLAAGVIPIYRGAPDIEQFVPSDCYIDLETFTWPSESEAARMVIAGQAFLRSPRGERFSYQAFARQIVSALDALSEKDARAMTPRSPIVQPV